MNQFSPLLTINSCHISCLLIHKPLSSANQKKDISIPNQIHFLLVWNRASKLQSQCHRFQVETMDWRLASSINKTVEIMMIP
uniref:Uncharacterized protein n=1 Tax=Arundo donax TaxID=35708 RepID=A0A0A9BFW1_ARUDO